MFSKTSPIVKRISTKKDCWVSGKSKYMYNVQISHYSSLNDLDFGLSGTLKVKSYGKMDFPYMTSY